MDSRETSEETPSMRLVLPAGDTHTTQIRDDNGDTSTMTTSGFGLSVHCNIL